MNELLSTEERITQELRRLFCAYGYTQYKMSKFEEYDLYVRNKSFLLSDSVITFTDTSGKLLALKPDVTLSIVKNAGDAETGAKKLYYSESVYRISERTGAFREISQTGLECLGAIDTYQLSEVLTLAAKSLACISPDYILDVSHLGLLSMAMDASGVSEGDRAAVLSFISQKNRHDLGTYLAERSIDEARAMPLLSLLACTGAPRAVLPRLASLLDSEEWRRSVDALARVLSPLPDGHVRIDFSVIHDLSYYNGIVFGGFVAGVPECVLSGGQYDRLMERMGKTAQAVGFAVYPDRLCDLDAPVDYDTDTVILYGEDADTLRVAALVEAHVARGERTLACRELPAKLTKKRLLKLEGSEVITLEENA